MILYLIICSISQALIVYINTECYEWGDDENEFDGARDAIGYLFDLILLCSIIILFITAPMRVVYKSWKLCLK